MRCEFTKVSLDRLPFPYIAMSFCWGDPTPQDQIWYNNHECLHFTAFAGSILWALLSVPVERHMCIWMVALCIDQRNHEEKDYKG